MSEKATGLCEPSGGVPDTKTEGIKSLSDYTLPELSVLIEMIPDRNDDRHRQAASSILEVERKVKGGK